MDDHGVVYEEFNRLDREVQSGLSCEGLGDVDGREGGVEGEVEAVFVACLAVGQSRELLAVSEELYLEARSANRVDLLTVEGEVCREEDLASLRLLVLVVIDGDGHANDTFEADGVQLRVVDSDHGVAIVNG